MQRDGGLTSNVNAARRRYRIALQWLRGIVDAQGASFTDASAWYWAALLGQSQGPWQAVTVASPL